MKTRKEIIKIAKQLLQELKTVEQFFKINSNKTSGDRGTESDVIISIRHLEDIIGRMNMQQRGSSW